MSKLLTVPAAEYHADSVSAAPSLSCSMCKIVVNQTMLHAWLAHPRLNPDYRRDVDESKFDIGTAGHGMLLEGDGKLCVINPEDYRSKPTKADPDGSVPKGWTNSAIREARDLARSNGLIPVLPWDAYGLKKMVTELRGLLDEFLANLGMTFEDGDVEQTLVWEEDGVHFRARTDWISKDRSIIIDLKFTDIGNPDQWVKGMYNLGYDIQEAFYKRAVFNVCGTHAQFFFAVQETFEPYLNYMVEATEAMQHTGRARVDVAVKRWSECIKQGTDRKFWPGYPRQVLQATPTSYQMAQAEELTINEQEEN